MTTEYLDAANSVCSNSFESIKRRRLLSDDFKNSDLDGENLMDYSGDNFPSEISAKASSSSIHESITNMSNSHSTPEDTFSEITLSSPTSKQCKPDSDIKDYEPSREQYSLNNSNDAVGNINCNEVTKHLPISSNNLKSIDDTIELVLSKIREENNFSKTYDFGDACYKVIKSDNSSFINSNDLSNCASNVNLQNISTTRVSAAVGSMGSDNVSYIKGSVSCQNSNISGYNIPNYSKPYSQFYNYNYGISPQMAASFPNQITASNYTEYNKMDYTRSNYLKENDKNKFYYPFQCQNPQFRPYLPNSYVNPPFYKSESQNLSMHNPTYQMFQKSMKRNYFDQMYNDDDNILCKDGSKNSNYYFKTPQPNTCGLIEQGNSSRKKRTSSDSNKLTPTKKRKLTNQFPAANNYDELIRKLKISNYNLLLMNPAITQSVSILSPKGFVDSSSKSGFAKKNTRYKKYRSSLFKIKKPKMFNDFSQEDRYLSHYLDESMTGNCILSQKRNLECDDISDIICGSPENEKIQVHNADNFYFQHLLADNVESDPRSPELISSFSKSKCVQNIKTESIEPKIEGLVYSKYHITPIVSYSENETKLITELHPTKSQELNRNYIQLSGSFLKRTKINGKSFSNIHIEEAVSIASLSASKNQNSCYYCYSILSSVSCIRKNSKLFGIDSPDELLFCSSSCYSNFKSCNITDCNSDKKSTNNNINSNSLQCTKVLIKTTPYKPPKNYKKVCDFEQYVRRRFPSEGQGDSVAKLVVPLNDSFKKRLLGLNYSYFKNESLKTIYKEIEKSDQNMLLKKYSCSYRKPDLIDNRLCILCKNIGDGDEDICGRLINIDADNWVHLNCALWCFEVFETVSGSLMEVESSLQKAIKTFCSFCNNLGAGIQCYRSKCTCVYHVPCAYKIGCIFYTDRGMYCPNHVVLNHPMHLPSLRVERRVNILRDESALITGMVTEDQDVKIKFRTGSLTLNNIGQLLPEQLISGNYNSCSIIYPVGYHSTRIYWSSTQINKRCKYECLIDESDDMPLFKVKFFENGCENVLTDKSCDKLWKIILNKIAKLRQDSGLTRLFPAYLSGEQLYGLTEPQIIRVIESLPGVEMIKNYAFKFGKMQLITEMPLAINPTGSARTEPKLRTYVRRSKDYQEKSTKCGILKAKPIYQPIIYEPTNLNKTALLNSRTQQYKRLKYEWRNNVILSRSKIQGLGLFAAKDFEKSTMIIEYIGEIIRNEVGNSREKLYQARNNSIYMFRLNEDLIIDATVNGGLARYINHSCNPNCVAETLSMDCGSRIIITTRQLIERGEELTYDYKFDFEDNKADRIPCLCGSINCRKWMN